ncbi:primase-helicase zinc-binding domain-containing protein [Cupriavidus basilensis]|uniref:primase-helicase zinc-binding domain-containing protein n=1 Tax=Cupriavidus basilensis TaxID=68895 RepID=UPI0023E8EF58|nr:primase-helicase zinc-binding domain-containing protein [Cupriavidus basilensis]MDF3882672.1 primase-helicase zinc-binding domain-containing protein [Cupriavidus basilensis]
MKMSSFTKNWTPDQWDALVLQYLPEQFLTGKPGPCPMCGGNDRFTYDNKSGRGDWVCRQCANGNPMAGDAILLICRYTGMSFLELAHVVEGGPAPAIVRPAHPAIRNRGMTDTAKAQRIERVWSSAKPLVPGDGAMRYLAARVPGLVAPRPSALRLAMMDYRHEGAVLGRYPTIVAQFTLPDGRMATVHRTTLDQAKPAKAVIVTADGEILPAKRNDVTALPLAGGAVRLMPPRDGVLGVAEGLETAYAAHMLYGVPTWNCLNRVLLHRFVVPQGMGIHTLHIFADFDEVDPKTGKSPGMADALALAKRIRGEGLTVHVHRPMVRGTDFCDQWLTANRLQGIAGRRAVYA